MKVKGFKQDGTVVYGWLAQFGEQIHIVTQTGESVSLIDIVGYQRCTGIRDKNGTEICADDSVVLYDSQTGGIKYYGKVVWDYGFFFRDDVAEVEMPFRELVRICVEENKYVLEIRNYAKGR